jgi:poly(U)-specific endoribonuclease
MEDIYQQIWNADQGHAGIKALHKGTSINPHAIAHGYVVVNENYTEGPDLQLLETPVIPTAKFESYQRVKVLFDNYRLDQWKYETNTRAEVEEIKALLAAIYKCPPMTVARHYLETQIRQTFSDQEWWDLIRRIWFEQFHMTSGKDLSGFEHVIVGEQEQGKVQGYHFWYKYYCDEHFQLSPRHRETDLITVLGSESSPRDTSPDIVRLKFQWNAYSYDAAKHVRLTKPVGEFWVGPSAEGMMAMGIVRFMKEAHPPRQAIINGVLYNLVVYKSPDRQHLRTFYPEFVNVLPN